MRAEALLKAVALSASADDTKNRRLHVRNPCIVTLYMQGFYFICKKVSIGVSDFNSKYSESLCSGPCHGYHSVEFSSLSVFSTFKKAIGGLLW